MAAAQLLNYLADVRAVNDLRAQIVADHEGYRHSELDWWLYDAREFSPKTCPVCLALANQMFRGDVIPYVFEYHTHQAVNVIRPQTHPHCYCRLRWAGRVEKAYNTPLGILLPEESRNVRYPSQSLLEQLSPAQLEQVAEILSSPWEL